MEVPGWEEMGGVSDIVDKDPVGREDVRGVPSPFSALLCMCLFAALHEIEVGPTEGIQPQLKVPIGVRTLFSTGRTSGWVDVWVRGCVSVWVGQWVGQWVGGRVDGQVAGLICGSVGVSVRGWASGWVGLWVGVWVLVCWLVGCV